jgi:hypothetical protein
MAKKKALPKGMYQLYIKGRKNPLIVQLQAIPIGEIVKLPNHNKNTDSYYSATEGASKFFVLCSRLSIYTSIGADNVHHASNKATKLFGTRWSSITKHDSGVPNHYESFTVARFNELVRGLQN